MFIAVRHLPYPQTLAVRHLPYPQTHGYSPRSTTLYIRFSIILFTLTTSKCGSPQHNPASIFLAPYVPRAPPISSSNLISLITSVRSTIHNASNYVLFFSLLLVPPSGAHILFPPTPCSQMSIYVPLITRMTGFHTHTTLNNNINFTCLLQGAES